MRKSTTEISDQTKVQFWKVWCCALAAIVSRSRKNMCWLAIFTCTCLLKLWHKYENSESAYHTEITYSVTTSDIVAKRMTSVSSLNLTVYSFNETRLFNWMKAAGKFLRNIQIIVGKHNTRKRLCFINECMHGFWTTWNFIMDSNISIQDLILWCMCIHSCDMHKLKVFKRQHFMSAIQTIYYIHCNTGMGDFYLLIDTF